MQSRLQSLIEQLFNIGSGFLISLLVWEYVVKPVWHLQTSFAENLHITCLFTVVSIARSYVWRRLFNRLNNKNKKVANDHTDRIHRPRGSR